MPQLPDFAPQGRPFLSMPVSFPSVHFSNALRSDSLSLRPTVIASFSFLSTLNDALSLSFH